MISVPTAEDLARANAEFDRDWGGVDDVLRELCRRHPGHTDRRSVTAKVALIGRAYAAGLERRVTPPKGQQAIVVIADYFERHGAEVDEILAPLHPIDEPLSLQGMATIVGVHGRFTQLLVGVTTDGRSPRSFASKYLHFHNPAVPIYDSYALAGIMRLVRWDAAEIPFGCPPGGDGVADGYYRFCVRFWRLLEACRDADREVVLYSSPDGDVSLDVLVEHESAWLTQKQMSELFDRDQSVISRHVRKAFANDELSPESNVQKVHIASSDKPLILYSLDAVIEEATTEDSSAVRTEGSRQVRRSCMPITLGLRRASTAIAPLTSAACRSASGRDCVAGRIRFTSVMTKGTRRRIILP